MLFAFGEFELDAQLCVLRRRGEVVPLQPKVFGTLRYLIEHRDHVVSKQELLDALWEGQVVSRIAIPWSVRHARRALGQVAAEPRPIETVRGRGYRFAADVRATPARSPDRLAVGPDETAVRSKPGREPFLGREPVMARLVDALNGARSGAGLLCLLTGEAGIGKSRCADELGRLARDSGMSVWTGRCVGAAGAPAFWPWIQILRECSEDRRMEPADLETVDALLGRLVPRESTSVDLQRMTSPTTSDASRFWLSEALARCVKQTARKRPRMVVVEDIHASDDGSLEVLSLLAPELSGANLLVVATARDDFSGDAAGRLTKTLRPCEVVAIAGLTIEQVGAYIVEALGHAAPPELVRSVYAKTAGNPLFLKEAVRLVTARRQRQGTLRAEDVSLPDAARGLLHDRIATLDAPMREVLDAAAVLGEDFELSALTRVLDLSPDDLLARIDAAIQARFLASRSQGGTYAFAHALLREALYELLPTAERVRLHGRVAAALQALLGAEPRYGAIAYHLHCALPKVNPADVALYSRLAGDAAMRVFDYDEAVTLYARALAAQSQGNEVDARATCELLLSASYALRRSGRVREARAHCRRAIEIAQRENFATLLVDAARSLRPTVWLAEVPDPLVLAAIEHARTILPADGDAMRAARAQAYGLLANLPPHSMNTATSRALASRAVQLARELGDRAVLLEAVVSTLHALASPDSLDELLAAADEVLRLDGAAFSWLSSEAYYARYSAFLQRGDPAGADRALEAFGECVRRLRMTEGIWQHDRLRAQQLLYSGDFEAAEARFHELFGRSQTFRAYGMFLYAGQMNALSWERSGRALPLSQFSVGESMEVSWKWAAAIPAFRAERILILLGAGDTTGASAEFEDLAKDAFLSVTHHLGYLYVLCRLALVAVALDRRPSARVLYDRLRPYAAYNAINALSICLGSVSHYLGVLARFLGRRADAVSHFEDSIAMNTRLGHKVHARCSQRALDEMAR